VCSEIHKLIYSIWNKKELLQVWKEFVIVPIYKKGGSTDCNNYQGIALSSSDKILFSILLVMLTPCTGKITGDHQYGL
jgi:hypothetical protein